MYVGLDSAADGLYPVQGLYVGGIGDLMPATETARYDGGLLGAVADGGEEAILTDLHRQVVMFFFVAK